MRHFLIPFAFFALAVQARAEVILQVSDSSAEYSDECVLEARLMNDAIPLNNQQVSFGLERADDDGVFRPVGGSNTAVTDSNGTARANIRLVNGRTGSNTVHELKAERSDDELWRSFSAGDYRIVARHLGGDLETGYGQLVIRREQAALSVHTVDAVAGDTPRITLKLEDAGDTLIDWDWSNDEAVESAKAGVQGRLISLWLDRNGDQQFYNCTAGGSCVDGHCQQCQSDEDCPGSLCDQGLCVAEIGANSCSVDDDCAVFFGVQGLHCLNNVCIAESCDYLGEVTTDILGRASMEFSTRPDEFGHPNVGYHELMLRAEFAGDAYYAGGASKGDLVISPGPLDMSQVPITITLNNAAVEEVGTTDTVAIEIRAYLSDAFGNLYGFNDVPYSIGEGDCSSCADDLCQNIQHPQCLNVLDSANLQFTASSGIFISSVERSPQDGAFMRRWRPNASSDSEVRFSVKLGEAQSPEKTIRLYQGGGCGCNGGSPVSLLWLLIVPALRRRRRHAS
jgi:hypothetical protein